MEEDIQALFREIRDFGSDTPPPFFPQCTQQDILAKEIYFFALYGEDTLNYSTFPPSFAPLLRYKGKALSYFLYTYTQQYGCDPPPSAMYPMVYPIEPYCDTYRKWSNGRKQKALEYAERIVILPKDLLAELSTLRISDSEGETRPLFTPNQWAILTKNI